MDITDIKLRLMLIYTSSTIYDDQFFNFNYTVSLHQSKSVCSINDRAMVGFFKHIVYQKTVPCTVVIEVREEVVKRDVNVGRN